MKKKLSKELSARTKADSSTKDEEMQVSPAIAKPIVVCSQSPPANNDVNFVESSSTFQVLCEETEVFVGSDGQILVKL